MPVLHKVWLGTGGLWIAAVFYLSLMPQPPELVFFAGIDKLEHALAYALLMLWFCQVFVISRARIRLLMSLAAMGIGIEILQGIGGYRAFEYADMLANLAGALAGWGLARTRMGQVILLLERHGKH